VGGDAGAWQTDGRGNPVGEFMKNPHYEAPCESAPPPVPRASSGKRPTVPVSPRGELGLDIHGMRQSLARAGLRYVDH
jgi:hypothetical protein